MLFSPSLHMASMVPSALSLRVFAGAATDDVDMWIGEARRALVAANLDSTVVVGHVGESLEKKTQKAALDRRAAAALLGCLTDAAAAAGRTLAPDAATEPEVVYTLLREFFRKSTASLSKYLALCEFRRKPGMSVNQVHAFVLDLCQQVNPHMDEMQKVTYFLSALGPLGKQVISRGSPSKLADALSAARDIEAAGATPSAVAAAAVSTLPPAVSQTAAADPALNAMLAELLLLLKSQRASAAVSGPSSGITPVPNAAGRRRGPFLANRFTDEGIPICNHCHQAGHIRSACPVRAGLTATVGAPPSAGSAGGGNPSFRQ